MNKKITLGLLVFFVGVLMAACGDDNNTTNTVTTTTIPKDFDTFDFGCRSCTKSFSGKFYVQNHQYFEDGFDVDTNSNFGFDTSFDNNDLNIFRPGGLNNLINGVLDVGGNILGARAFCNGVDVFLDDEDELECDLDTVYGNSDDDLRDTYASSVSIRVDANNRVTDIDLAITSTADDDYDENVREDFFDTSDRNVFDGNGGLKMRNNDGRLEVWIGTSKRIGYFRR